MGNEGAVATALAKAISDRGWPITRIAIESNVSRATIYAIMKCKCKPTIDTLHRLSGVLNINLVMIAS